MIFANIYGSSESRFWTYVGERKVDYNQKFRLYLLTDSIGSMNSRSLALFRVVNMSPSFDSITTQLLRHIINIKRPELEAEKEKVENNVRDLRKQLKQLEAELLEKLSAESGNILDNVQLIEQLKHLKSSASSVQQSLSESNQLREDLDCERKQYESIAQFAAKLYFSVENLPKLNSMYYVGYGEFEKLFQDVLRRNANNFTNDTLCYVRLANFCLQILIWFHGGFFCRNSTPMFLKHCLPNIVAHYGSIFWEIFPKLARKFPVAMLQCLVLLVNLSPNFVVKREFNWR